MKLRITIIAMLIGTIAWGEDITSGLIAHWTFDEKAGTSLADSSGNANNGACQNVQWVSGKNGNAGLFNITNGFVSIASKPSFDYSKGLTVSAWVNMNSLEIFEHPGGKLKTTMFFFWSDITSGAKNGTTAYLTPAGLFGVRIADEKGYTMFEGTNKTVLGQWTHLAYTYDNSAIVLYVNGIPDGRKEVAMTIATNNLMKFIGKCAWGPYHFSGIIDDMRVYGRALSASEVKLLAQ